ncbi:MAG TPA: hypothetical protein VKV15_14465 [Bryobacteraceae bacterium]|nr:hypothetical protein [Bryobacteraceae bacterium]
MNRKQVSHAVELAAVNYHEGRPIIRSAANGDTIVLCPYGRYYTRQSRKDWAGSWLEAKASDPNRVVRCHGTLPEDSK